ncbi:peptide/nickel transport system ATP-binding protein [Amycolatopsis arida]|uniref:Peptide/nickel transport system ATP-binding protein n=1 Tax=Amycolatopsis arida TaxID=587909 RepID=A0A1I5LU07_9PSEU|nr:ATP-binding cassette domain-containing protein [Amycolatopsis arida]TDX93828.1 peptide/nickel transport system ATP-binding protein [Amycolatopsis arida]SFP00256.1 peptide/nickel transport system ATP-binding protein [Amycolatopsis arida]
MTPALDVRGLSVRYATGTLALSDVDLRVEPGECVALVGESGCGKTTLARAVLGLLPARAAATGAVRVAGRGVLGAPAARLRELRGRLVGYVGQDPFAACDPLRTVGHHVAEAWRAHGLAPPPGEVVRRLAALDVPEPAVRGAEHPHRWSGGMLQRATVAAATVHGPPLTVADEPTSALDADLARAALRGLRRASDALLLISHDLDLVAEHADRVVVLAGGRVVEWGPTGAVLAAPAHEATRRLVDAAAPVPLPATAVTRSTRSTRSGPPVVAARGVRRHYGPVRAVDGVTVEIGAAEVLGVVGPSGAGKSTLLRLLGGIERPDAGTVEFAGVPAWPPGRRRPVLPRPGYVMPVFQDPRGSLDRRWPLWRSITEPLVLAHGRMPAPARRRRARTELARVGLGGVDVTLLPGQLSVGQAQRVAIVRALIARPALIVADEPTASLDPTTARDVAALLREAAGSGAALAVVSHDVARLSSYVDTVLALG